MNLQVAVVTTNRAEYGLLYWLLDALFKSSDIDTYLVVSGAHVCHQYGYTVNEIESSPWPISFQFDYLQDGIADIGEQLATISTEFGGFLKRRPIDLLILLGDRYELLPFANLALLHGVKIAHISGGELTEGAVDDKVRHALTKLSDIHFVGNETFRKRVIQMGELPERVYAVGELGLEHIHHRTPIPLFDKNICPWKDPSKPFILLTFHPETSDLANDPLEQQLEVLEAVARFLGRYNVLVTYPNCDRKASEMIASLHDFATLHSDSVHLEASLGFKRYGQALSETQIVVGNSSSGLYEAPSYHAVTVNVGNRQTGRLKGNTVIDCANSCEDIVTAIELAEQMFWTLDSWQNPYGDGHCADKVLSILRRDFQKLSSVKPFFDL